MQKVSETDKVALYTAAFPGVVIPPEQKAERMDRRIAKANAEDRPPMRRRGGRGFIVVPDLPWLVDAEPSLQDAPCAPVARRRGLIGVLTRLRRRKAAGVHTGPDAGTSPQEA